MEGTSKSGSRMQRSDDSESYDQGHVAPAAASGRRPFRRNKYNRHTPSQVQELESYFKLCPHPDDRQRRSLGNRLGLNCKQVKFWFQNKRTQLKTQLERHENAVLKQEFEQLKTENANLKEYIHKPICTECGAESDPVSMQEHKTRLENARLKQELNRVCGVAEALYGKPVSEMVVPVHQPAQPPSPEEANPVNEVEIAPQPARGGASVAVTFGDYEKKIYLHVAMAAMDELIVLARNEPPYWHRILDGGTDVFNHEEYFRKYNPYGSNSPNFAYEATRETCSVIINSLELVNILMQPGRWAGMFCSMVARVSNAMAIYDGVGGTHDGELLLIEAEFSFPSPFVPVRHMRFLRFCKRYGEGMWAIVDISVDPPTEAFNDITKRCRKLPSGYCIMQDATNVYSMVTALEHVEYDESVIHSLFRPFVRSGCAFGAERWLATLQRQCAYATYLPTSGITPLESSIGITPEGRKCILKLSRRIVDSFCSGICVSSASNWEVLKLGETYPNLQVKTRSSKGAPGEPCGITLSFSTCILVPVPRQQLFEFLRNGQLRGHWDILADDGPMEETVRVVKSTHSANSVTILCPPVHEKEANMAVLQETWADKTSSVVVYSVVNTASITRVMEGGDPDLVKLLPSGFVITDTFMQPGEGKGFSDQPPSSLLTLGFQILMNTSPMTAPTADSIRTVNDIMAQTIIKIKAALGCD